MIAHPLGSDRRRRFRADGVRGLASIAALGIAVVLCGCSEALAPSATGTAPLVPVQSLATGPTDAPTGAPTGDQTDDGVPEPEATDAATETPPEPSGPPPATGGGAPQATGTSAGNDVKIGSNDYRVLEWRVSCTGLDAEPSILATAAGSDGTKYVIMLLADREGQLISLSFSASPPNAGHADKSGLTVTPATGQGAGTFLADGAVVSSDGRGVSYGPYDQDFSVDTTYSLRLVCPTE